MSSPHESLSNRLARWLRCALPPAAAPLVLALAACDDSQAWHAPDFSFARMQEQPRVDPFDPQMAAPPPFTVARRDARDVRLPVVTREVVERGRGDFDTICAACHGVRGDGQSAVARKMLLRPPPSLLEPRIRALSDERLAEIVARGYGLMPPFANALPSGERIATIAYLRSLQIAQAIDVRLLPAPVAGELAARAP